jgi:hypothetical protein
MSTIESPTSLASFVSVRQSGIRSVNVEQDLQQAAVAEGYILTAQARRSLERILDRIDSTAPQRAWTLTGPYGSGKSYFGLFLMNLLGASGPAHAQTLQQLQDVDPILSDKVTCAGKLEQTNGFLPIAITGYRTTLQECVRQGLRRLCEQFREHKEIKAILNDAALWSGNPQSRMLTSALRQVVKVLTQPALGYSGVLLILDEMGKPLEYATTHPDEADIYLLQELAELANRSGDTPFLFVGLLHQAFERYAGHADGLMQREWAKIQGRFEDIAFQEPPTQQMWLLANALEYANERHLCTLWPDTEALIEEAIQGDWRPSLMKEDEFRRLCCRVRPFHPTAMVALPYLFQRLAQNERSMFVYLTSLEPLGFQEYLAHQVAPTRVRLCDLFDYLAANYQGRLYSSLRARPLTETLERLENEPNLSAIAIELLKTIGLLNWLAEIGPFQASAEKLLFAVRTPDHTDGQICEALQKLQKQSTIVFRRFNQTYTIWQGSDVDIEERIAEARQHQLATFSTAQAVQQYLLPQPLVARRHSYETGTTRYFEVRYVDLLIRDQLSLKANAGASGLVLLCLSASSAEAETFVVWAADAQFQERTDLIFGVMERTARLTELLQEMRCLHWVRDNTPELRDDPVARRELRTRLSGLETLIRNELDQTLRLHRFTNGVGCRWFHGGKEVSQLAQRSLSPLLSRVCDQLFAASPWIRNEILNRRQLSSQGAAARRNLLEAMLLRPEKMDLAIEGFPPERSMYESLLKAGELHREVGAGRWALCAPLPSDPLRLATVWQAINDYVFALPLQPRGVHEFYAILSKPPYGLTEGVLPVLLCAFLLVNGDETTLYNEGSLLPEPGIADWEVLLRRPELFAVAGCRIVGPRMIVVQRLASGLQTKPAVMPVVRELIRRLKSLPEHAWRTQRLSETTLATRRAIELARSPERLLFQELPVVFGLTPFAETESVDSGQVEQFFAKLNGALQELSQAMPTLLSEARDQLLQCCGLASGPEGWEQFLRLAKELAPKVHQPSLAPLLRRASEAADPRQALESTLAYIANRPPRMWTDSDRERFMQQSQSLGDLLQRERQGHDAETGLTAAQRHHSRYIAENIRTYLGKEKQQDPLLIRAALETLLQEYRQLQ